MTTARSLRRCAGRWPALAALVALAPLVWATAALAQTATENAPGRPYFAPNERFAASSGREIYDSICQGCHMPRGAGAAGAGRYPALAGDANLASARYVAQTVLNGRKAMPPFGNALDDAQVAQVVNYVRGQLGNGRADQQLLAADVQALRAAPPASAAR